MKRLQDKKAVITGGSGGIGAATAKMMINEGAKVLITDLDEKALKEVAADIDSPDLHWIAADVSDEEQVKKYADKAKELFGHVDVFLNNAGIEGQVKPLDEYPMDVFRKIVDVNIYGVYYGLRYIFPLMKEHGGSVIITSSLAGVRGHANMLPYVASKHANSGMMRSAALEGAPHKIRVNSINPSPVDNRMMRSLEEGFSPGESKATKEKFEQIIPLGRYATNDEVASLAVFLASDDSQFITGSTHMIDGGMSAS